MATDTESVVIVSNRLPVHRVQENGESVWRTSPGGLVSALTPILAKHDSTWIGWTGEADTTVEPFELDDKRNVPVPLTSEEVELFYEGFSNRTIWPLYHDSIRTPEFRRRWWWPYVEVNKRFADRAAELAGKNGTVWIHDYHLQLVPSMLREARPDLRIGFFMHIPFPPPELFAQLPWRRQIIEGMLGADVVGFQTTLAAQNFLHVADRYTEAKPGERQAEWQGRRIRVDAFPISIDVDRFETQVEARETRDQTVDFCSRLGHDRKVILGVDRLDYTKGIPTRLRAFGELLRHEYVTVDDCVLVQVAVPSRERVEEYQELRHEVEQYVGSINGEFGQLGRTPIHYLHRGLPFEELVSLYAAADVMLVTPLRDGMNLVAKEYVASRSHEDGVLVLSEFTGSAYELTEALLVNPHDIDGLIETIHAAINLPVEEQTRRMKELRQSVRRNTVYDWAESFFKALTG